MIQKDNSGIKYDECKSRWDLLPYDALAEIAKVMTYGAIKYEPRNWERGMSWNRVFASMQRHLSSWFQGKDVDDESTMSHLAHAACCMLYLLAFECRGEGVDDRPKLNVEALSGMENCDKVKEFLKKISDCHTPDIKPECGIKPRYA